MCAVGVLVHGTDLKGKKVELTKLCVNVFRPVNKSFGVSSNLSVFYSQLILFQRSEDKTVSTLKILICSSPSQDWIS